MNELRALAPDAWPALLHEIADPPEKLYVRGTPAAARAYLTVVGSRRYSPYGRDACQMLISGLRGQQIAIVSGLALGIDGIAHEAALAAGLACLAIPGSGLDDAVLYPASHKRLAWRILKSGGCLLSEYEPDFQATQWSFVKRNRLMAGIAHAVLIIEATERSGTLVTARLALEYNRDVLAVPGPITQPSAYGPNALIRDGATPITHAGDIIEALGFEQIAEDARDDTPTAPPGDLNDPERRAMALLADGPLARDELMRALALPVHEANVMLSMMEVKGIVRHADGYVTRL